MHAQTIEKVQLENARGFQKVNEYKYKDLYNHEKIKIIDKNHYDTSQEGLKLKKESIEKIVNKLHEWFEKDGKNNLSNRDRRYFNSAMYSNPNILNTAIDEIKAKDLHNNSCFKSLFDVVRVASKSCESILEEIIRPERYKSVCSLKVWSVNTKDFNNYCGQKLKGYKKHNYSDVCVFPYNGIKNVKKIQKKPKIGIDNFLNYKFEGNRFDDSCSDEEDDLYYMNQHIDDSNSDSNDKNNVATKKAKSKNKGISKKAMMLLIFFCVFVSIVVSIMINCGLFDDFLNKVQSNLSKEKSNFSKEKSNFSKRKSK